MINLNVIVSSDWLFFEKGQGLFEIGCPRSMGWKNFGHKWTRGGGWGQWGVLKIG